MSIRTNPMKAVPLLLKHLSSAEKRADVDDLKTELIKIKDVFSIVKKNEDELLDTLTLLYNYIRSSNIDKLVEEKEDICNRIRISTQKLLPADAIQAINTEAAQSSQNMKQHMRHKVNTAQPSSSRLEDLEMLKVNYTRLYEHKTLFLSLLHLPEYAVLKKRFIFLWWHMVSDSRQRDWHTESTFKIMIDRFFDEKLILAHGDGKCPVVNKFKVNPAFCSHKSLIENDAWQFGENYSQIITSSRPIDTYRRTCLVLDQRKVKLRDDQFGFKSNHWKAIVNVGASYLNFGPQWLSKMKHLEVLQLGRCLHDSPKHHIEVENQEFLKELRQQKNLWYLSLRGISQISNLPPSIVQLESLEVLDLKACHNLETLPDDISSLRKLTHLDLSHCYLLDKMPKGIDKLSELQVLKGFVIGSSIKTPCRISDISNLKKLKRLSIHIASGAVIQDWEFESLKELLALEHIKISWGVSDTKYSDIQVILPSRLKKLHLEGFPGQQIPDWLKSSPELKELNITGGKLNSVNHGENNDHRFVEIVRLKYLKHLKVDLTNLQELFPRLSYVEIRQILNHSYLEWSIND